MNDYSVTVVGDLPAFDSEEWAVHVEAWRKVHEQVEERLWMLGAIAASLTRHYGDKAIPEFASEVGYSARRVWEMAATYKAWQNRDRAHDLSFKHHTIAARAEDPEAAIETAIEGTGQRPGPMSTRELEEAIKGEPSERGAEGNVEAIEMVACPKCGEVYPLREAEVRTEAIE